MKALVVGDTGLVGRYLTSHLIAQGWSVCGLSRRPRDGDHIRLVGDLQNQHSIEAALTPHADITHVFYAGRAVGQDAASECTMNTDMFCNLIRAVATTPIKLRHVQLMQGLKWYGSQHGAYRNPARETDPRHDSVNFYYAQQDWLVEHLASKEPSGTTWSAVRPHQVAGFSDQYPHNLAAVIALYGSLCRALNKPLDFPGTRECYNSVSMVMDADLLAQSMIYIATQKATQNQAFNVGNGDYLRWCNVWPRLAEFFGVPCGAVGDCSLVERFGSAQPQWQQLVKANGLLINDMEQIASWQYGDFTFRAGHDDMASLSAIRGAGFDGWRDSEDALLATLAEYRQRRVIP